MSKRSLLVLAIAAVLMLVFFEDAALAHTPSPPVCNDPVCNIDIQDDFFQPSSITIRPPNSSTGESVMIVWFNHGVNLHSVTSGTPPGTPDGIINQNVTSGDSFSLNITESLYTQILSKYPNGVLPYYCRFHYPFGMTATMTITGDPIPEFSPPAFLLTIAAVSSVILWIIARPRRRGSNNARWADS